MLNFIRSFFLFQKVPPPTNNEYHYYYIDPHFEDLRLPEIEFVSARTNYRMTADEFEELFDKIRFNSNGYFFIVRLLKLLHILFTVGWVIYLILYFTTFKTHSASYLLFTFVIWMILKVITRILRMKTLRKAKEIIDVVLNEENQIKFHKRGLEWRLTSYAQYLQLNLQFNPYEFARPIRSRVSSELQIMGSMSSPVNHLTNISTPLLSFTSPRRPSHGSIALYSKDHF